MQLYCELTPCTVRKISGTQRRTQVTCILCTTVCEKAPQAEAISNNEKIKPITVAVIELCLSEGISQSVS